MKGKLRSAIAFPTLLWILGFSEYLIAVHKKWRSSGAISSDAIAKNQRLVEVERMEIGILPTLFWS